LVFLNLNLIEQLSSIRFKYWSWTNFG